MAISALYGTSYGIERSDQFGFVSRYDFDLRTQSSAAYDGHAGNFGSALDFDNFQTIFIDNSANTSPLEVENGPSGFRFSIAAGAQGYFPIFLSPNATLLILRTPGAVVIPTLLISKPIGPSFWMAVAANAGQIINGFQPGGALSSGQVTVGTVRVTLLNNIAVRKAVRIKNRGAAMVFVGGSGVTLANGYGLAPGEVLSCDSSLWSGAIAAISASADNTVDYLFW